MRSSGQLPEFDNTDLDKNIKEARLSRRNTPIPSTGAFPIQKVESSESSYQSTTIGPLHHDSGDRHAGHDDLGSDTDPEFEQTLAESSARTAEILAETDRLLGKEREDLHPETGQYYVSDDEQIQQQVSDQLASDTGLSHQPEPSTPHHHRERQSERLETPRPQRPEELTAVQRFEEQVENKPSLEKTILDQIERTFARAKTPVPGLDLTPFQINSIVDALLIPKEFEKHLFEQPLPVVRRFLHYWGRQFKSNPDISPSFNTIRSHLDTVSNEYSDQFREPEKPSTFAKTIGRTGSAILSRAGSQLSKLIPEIGSGHAGPSTETRTGYPFDKPTAPPRPPSRITVIEPTPQKYQLPAPETPQKPQEMATTTITATSTHLRVPGYYPTKEKGKEREKPKESSAKESDVRKQAKDRETFVRQLAEKAGNR